MGKEEQENHNTGLVVGDRKDLMVVVAIKY